MTHRLQGLAHAQLIHLTDRIRRGLVSESGQGTVEYVALILLIAGIFAAVVTATNGDFGIGHKIANTLKEQIDHVGGSKSEK